jgi:hypothetical protein
MERKAHKLCLAMALRLGALADWLRRRCEAADLARVEHAVKEARRTCDEVEEEMKREWKVNGGNRSSKGENDGCG